LRLRKRWWQSCWEEEEEMEGRGSLVAKDTTKKKSRSGEEGGKGRKGELEQTRDDDGGQRYGEETYSR